MADVLHCKNVKLIDKTFEIYNSLEIIAANKVAIIATFCPYMSTKNDPLPTVKQFAKKKIYY